MMTDRHKDYLGGNPYAQKSTQNLAEQMSMLMNMENLAHVSTNLVNMGLTFNQPAA